ncbi:MAG: META domain-containing protein [Spirosomaceae bacterium]|nr:META domain-containing protein [Spirosomataceae bacterium]
MRKLMGLLIVSTLLVSCQSDVVESEDSKFSLASSTNDMFGKWNFKTYADGKGHKYDVTLELKDERASGGELLMSGRSSINFYTAVFKFENDKIKIGPIGLTKIAGPPDALEFELNYIENLRLVEKVELKDKNTMLLHLSAPSKEVMTFTRSN